MKTRSKIAIGCVVGAFILSTIIGRAQEQQASTASAELASVESGDYKPLTVWTSITLGTSYYTNPQKASTINVAYSFDGPEFASDFKSRALWDLAKQGKISFGLSNKTSNTIVVVPLSELQKKFPVASPTELTTVLARDDVSVVADNKNLLGSASPAPIVKTTQAAFPK